METHIAEPMEAQPRKRRRIPLWITVPACLLLGFLLLVSVLFARIRAEEHPSLSLISKWTDVKFPRSTKLLNSKARAGWGNCYLHARIEMDRSDLTAFINSLPKSKMNQHWDFLGFQEHDGAISWWCPHSARKSRIINIHQDLAGDEVKEWRMLIDLGNPHTAVVYLEFLGG